MSSASLEYDFEDDASATFRMDGENIGRPSSGAGSFAQAGPGVYDIQNSEELDALFAENMLLKEELGRISLSLQRVCLSMPSTYVQVVFVWIFTISNIYIELP